MGKKKLIAIISSIAAAVVLATIIIIIVVASNNNNNPGPSEDGYRTIKVFETTGTVEVEREENIFAASQGQNLKSGDYVNVGASSAAIMKLDEDKFVYAGENTKLHLTATGEKGHTKTNLFVVEGTAIVELKSKLVNDESFDISSANTAMAIRGTQIKITVEKTNDGYVIEYMVAEGKVEISAVEQKDADDTTVSAIKEKEMEVITFTIPLDEAILEAELSSVLEELTATVFDSVEDYKKEYDDVIVNYRNMTQDEYNEIKAIVDEFRVDEEGNYWTRKLSINNTTYGQEYSPSAVAKSGTVVYKYSSDGITYTGEKPVNAGTYYVIAYTSDNTLESAPRMFTISKAIPVFPHLSITAPKGVTAEDIANQYLGDWYFQVVTVGALDAGNYVIIHAEDDNFEAASTSFRLIISSENDPKCSVTSINVEFGKTLSEYASLLPRGWEFVSPEFLINVTGTTSTQVRTVVDNKTYYDSVTLVVGQPANISIVKSIEDDTYQVMGYDPDKKYVVGDTINLYIVDSTVNNYEFIAIKNGDEVVCRTMPTEENPYTITVAAGDVTYVIEFKYSKDDFIFSNGVVTSVNSSEAELVIPAVDNNGNPITQIGAGAFKENTNLVSITIPSTVTEIGANAFDGCTNLKNITINDDVSRTYARQRYLRYSDTSGRAGSSKLVKIGDYAFRNCTALQNIELPNSVEEFGIYAFSGCTALQIITVPNNLEKIGDAALQNTAIKSFDMSTSNVTYIGGSAFANCSALETFIPSDTLKYIGRSALPSASNNSLIFTYADDENVQYLGNSNNPYMIIYNRRYSNDLSHPFTLKNEAMFVYDNAFDNETYVENIPTSLVGVGYRAFYYCQRIENPYTLGNDGVTKIYSSYIPASIEYIGVEAFYYNTRAISIEFSSNLQSIDTSAFSGCLQLEKVTFTESENEVSIGAKAFKDCTGLRYLTLTDNIDLSNYNQFSNTAIQELNIPNIKYVYSAFTGCLSLETVNVAASVEELDSTFCDCTALKTVVFADGSKLDRLASTFNGCTALESVNIPASISYISQNCFDDCPAIVETEEDNLIYQGIDDNKYAIVKSLTEAAYSDSEVTEITIHEGAKLIYPYVFQGSYVQKVTLPESMTSISAQAFASTSSYYKCPVETVIVSENNKITSIGACAFQNSKVTGFAIPATVTYIGESAFANSNITEATLPEGLTEINDGAFALTSITSIVIPASVKTIGVEAFSGCTSLTSFTFAENATVESIGDYAFNSCKFTSFTLPASVKSLGTACFEYCANLEAIDISHINELPELLFRSCSKLASVTLSPTISKLSGGMFQGCSSLTSITIPATVKEIGNGIFSYCSGLTEINFENGSILTTIPDNFANGCTSLTSLAIPMKVVSIGTNAFYDSPITSLTFEEGSYLNTISSYAFYKAQLTSLVLPEKTLSIGSYAFYNSRLKSLEVSYEAVVGESAFAFAQIETTAIGNANYVLDSENNPKELLKVNDNTITEFTIPNTVKKIGANAFKDCKSLTSITIPASVIQIDKSAFSGCYNLSEINFAENGNLRIIGESAFYNCYALTEVRIPEGVTTIGNYAFNNSSYSSSVHTVYLPSTLTTIGNSAFSNCKNLIEVYNDSALIIKANAYDPYGLGSYAKWVGTTASSKKGVGIYNDNGILLTKINSMYFVVGYTGEASDMVLPNSLTYYDETVNEYYVNEYAFIYNTNITSLTIGTGVIAIKDYAFFNASSIKSITLQQGSKLTTFGYNSFKVDASYVAGVATGKSSLEEVIIPTNNSLTEISGYAFDGNIKLATFDLKNATKLNKIGEYAFEFAAFEEVYVPRVNQVGNYVFQFNDNLKKVTIADGFNCTYGYMFANCRSIEEITMSLNTTKTETYYIFKLFASSTTYGYNYGSDFVNPTNYSSVKIPKSFTKLTITGGNLANLNNVPSLKEIVIGENVTTFGSNIAFNYCTGLEKIYYNAKNAKNTNSAKLCDAGKNAENGLQIIIGNTVESLDGYFSYCGYGGSNYITSIVFAEGCQLTSLPANCFKNNANVTSITIPACITSISKEAFVGCSGLIEINYEGSSYIWNLMNLEATDINSATVNCNDSTSHLLTITTIGYEGDVEYKVDSVVYTAPINMPQSHRFSLSITVPTGYAVKTVVEKYVIAGEEKSIDLTEDTSSILMNTVPVTIEVEFVVAE